MPFPVTEHYIDIWMIFFEFKAQFIKKYSRYKKIGYNSSVLQQTACLVVNPITVGNYAFLFNCIHCSTHIRQYQSSFSGESDASTCLSLVLVSFSLVRRCCFCYFRSFWWFVFCSVSLLRSLAKS